jgi:ribosomal protein S12 methylthiotransferase
MLGFFLMSTLREFHKEHIAKGLKISMVSLGCVRNTVDSESMMGTLERKGVRFSGVEGADAVIVNTCGFIADAKRESIDTILELLELKRQGKVKRVIVAGCLTQRYVKEMLPELKGVDAYVGVPALRKDARQAKGYLTPKHFGYLKICESCFNKCSFCAIPAIKGRFASRTMEAVLEDVRRFDKAGIRELNIVGQDVTAYGLDIYREKKLAELLRKIAQEVRSIEWLRLLYTYPVHITDELLEVVASEPRVCKYLDVPLQHVSDRILKKMNRNITKAQTVKLIERIRRKVPGVFLRTTFIVGFPGETDRDFAELLGFLKDHPFERVGVFQYSREEGTKAYALAGQVPERVKRARLDRLMKIQAKAAGEFHESMVGRVIKILVEELEPGGKYIYTGRSEYDAPDVDGACIVRSPKPLVIGRLVPVKITAALGYDLEGEAVV